MKKLVKDYRFIFGILMAHLLLLFSFDDKTIFWYIFTATYLILISYAIVHEEADDESPFFSYLGYGISSGLFLFGLFWLGRQGIDWLNLSLSTNIGKLYKWFAPSLFWHYIALILIAVPGEELFWRGFVYKRLEKYATITTSILLSSVLYASVHLYSGQWLLVFAALVGGLFWSGLYAWKRSMPLVIVSHLIFDLLMFIVFPLN